MGIPWAIAPEEAEAYCAYLTKEGDYDYVLSPDADCFMFGATQVIRPVKENKKKVYYIYRRKEILKQLGIKQKHLLNVGLCLGTDFSKKVMGIGVKTVVKKVLADNIVYTEQQLNAKNYFKSAPHKGAKVKRKKFNRDKLIKFLMKLGFDLPRLSGHIESLEKLSK